MATAYAVLSPKGELVTVAGEPDAARAAAARISPRVSFEGVEDGRGSLGDASPITTRMPQQSLRATGLRPISMRQVQAMSLDEAYERLIGFFPKTRRVLKTASTMRIARYDTPARMATAFLGQNYKTSKEDPRGPAVVQGLSLLPYDMSVKFSRKQLPLSGLGLCIGSSPACREGCLVYAGHNAVPYNTRVKLSRTEALLLQPVAFARMLVENIRWHAEKTKEMELFIRLNVFSDVPWELVFPELFAEFSNVHFYD